MTASPWFPCRGPLDQSQATRFILTCSKLLTTLPEPKVSDAKQDQDQAEQRSDAAQQLPCSKSCMALSQSAHSSPLSQAGSTHNPLTQKTPSLLVLLDAESASC